MDGGIAMLQRENPGWEISSVWTSAASGPDFRRLMAYWCIDQKRVLLTAWNAAELRQKILQEEDSS